MPSKIIKRQAKKSAAKPKKNRTAKKGSKKQVPFAFKDLLNLKSLTRLDLDTLFSLTDQVKKAPEKYFQTLKGKTIGLLFQKPSSRTRISFEVGMSQLGGHAVYLSDSEIRLGQREPIRDIARIFSGYLNGVVLRTFAQATLDEFAKMAAVPVINGLSDEEHPCQVLSDLYTVRAKYGKLTGINLTYIGDSNNVLRSMMYGAVLTGMNLTIISPRGYEPSEEDLKEIKSRARETGSKIAVSNNPFSSLKNTHVIYTDVWTSMGQERQREQRLRDFQSFQVNQTIVSKALPDALVMHCLPAHRGEEITDEVLEGPHSIVFDQAANKLHLQKALMILMLGKRKK